MCRSHSLREQQKQKTKKRIICYMKRTKIFEAGTSLVVPERRLRCRHRRRARRACSTAWGSHCDTTCRSHCTTDAPIAVSRSDKDKIYICIYKYIYILAQSTINGWVLDSGMRNDNGHHIGREHAERQWQKSMRLPGMHACANVCVLCNHHMHAHDTCWQPSVRKLGLSYGWVMNELFWVTFELPALIST